ncbi:thioredoxin fold domain-containing protein [Terrimonas sp. NA20]|uniref:Thioredoxin fold domain-containing protein n=1 Tax=Terrimonas ginsenosidimutans TaxID=2908004 RepID=A0ABS9KRP7_9BACT|nr:thioredoxin fold domain-containing protein [Terrimonas ginsenosidimutans]MCG2615001.1 thioredoxin fold domain-containing protein [Terrimonas ginsenosidimutans]
MKRIALHTSRIIAVLFLTVIGMKGFSQVDSTSPPFKKFPTFPPVKLLLVDSVTTFSKTDLNKKKPTMIMLFSPDCDHCKHETEELIKRIDDFKDVQILMITPMPFENMREYYQHFGLAKYSNIKMGRDTKFMLPTFYNMRFFPFLAFYNKKQELISVFEGNMPMDKILEELKK